eukprot:11945670-Alexandrium_andersonii.AAC.1
MSASLVGSEMCIRDRTETQKPSEAVNRVVSRVCAERELQGLGPPLLLDCLLYTSDAADDM